MHQYCSLTLIKADGNRTFQRSQHSNCVGSMQVALRLKFSSQYVATISLHLFRSIFAVSAHQAAGCVLQAPSWLHTRATMWRGQRKRIRGRCCTPGRPWPPAPGAHRSSASPALLSPQICMYRMIPAMPRIIAGKRLDMNSGQLLCCASSGLLIHAGAAKRGWSSDCRTSSCFYCSHVFLFSTDPLQFLLFERSRNSRTAFSTGL